MDKKLSEQKTSFSKTQENLKTNKAQLSEKNKLKEEKTKLIGQKDNDRIQVQKMIISQTSKVVNCQGQIDLANKKVEFCNLSLSELNNRRIDTEATKRKLELNKGNLETQVNDKKSNITSIKNDIKSKEQELKTQERELKDKKTHLIDLRDKQAFIESESK